MIAALAGVTASLTGVGLAQALVASRLVASFARKARQTRWQTPAVRPAVTVLKPLHGNEPLLEEALTTLCRQDFPDFQIVFGVQDAADPAVAVVRRLQTRFPDVDIALVVDAGQHGANRKVGNLINMLPAARHDVLVIADSDVHVRPDYLDHLVAALQRPGVGLVTTLYAGLPVVEAKAGPPAGPAPDPALSVMAGPVPAIRAQTDRGAMDGGAMDGGGMVVTDHAMTAKGATLASHTVPPAPWYILPARLGATQITHGFLPGALLARALGRQDCLGATMCLRRHDLARIGGLPALVEHLADDNVLGRRIAALGLSVTLADTVVLTTVPEPHLTALFRHELRWARTIRALEPAAFAASILQYKLAWALLTIALTGGALWSIGLFFIAWVLGAVAAFGVDRALAPLWTDQRSIPERSSPDCSSPERSSPERRSNDDAALAFCCPVWLLPLRDVFSVAVMLASYGGRQVDWRGQSLQADTPPPLNHQSVTSRPTEGNHAR